MNKRMQTTINGKNYEIDIEKLENLYNSVKEGPGDTPEEKLTNALEEHPDLAPDIPHSIVPSGPGSEDEG